MFGCHMTRPRTHDDRGAAAVEFALIIPVLLLLVFGIMEFARLYNEQIELTSAARAGVRSMAIGNNQGAAAAAAIDAAPSLSPALSTGQVSFAPGACTSGGTMKVTISYSSTMLTGWFGVSMPLKAVAATPCGG